MATITFENIPTQPTTKNAAIGLLTHASVDQKATVVSSDGATRTTEYVYATGDPADNTTVTVRIAWDSKNDVVRHSIRLGTTEDIVNGEIVTRRPVEVVIAWNTPGMVISDTTQMLAMIGTAFALLAGSFDGSTGVPALGVMNAINFGITESLWG